MAQAKKWAGPLMVAMAMALIFTNLVQSGIERTEAAAVKSMMLAPSDFVPADEAMTWLNQTTRLYGTGTFRARVALATNKRITGVTVYFFDNNILYDLCLRLDIVRPATADDIVRLESNLCSSGGSTMSPNSVNRMFATPYKILANEVPYVTITFAADNPTLFLRGVAVHYR